MAGEIVLALGFLAIAMGAVLMAIWLDDPNA